MSQRFEDNIIQAITTSNVELLKTTLEKSGRTIAWNQTYDGLSVLALCIKFFHPEIVKTLYPPSQHSLPDEVFTYIIEHAPQAVVEAFAANVIATLNEELDENNLWNDDNLAEQVLKTLERSTQHIVPLINHSSCKVIKELLENAIGSDFLSVLLFKAVEWDNAKLLHHALEQIQQEDLNLWPHLAYKDWTTAHIHRVYQVYAAQSHPALNTFLDQMGKSLWHTLPKAHHTVALYSIQALKHVLNNDNAANTNVFVQNASQDGLRFFSDTDVLTQLNAKELKRLLRAGQGRVIDHYRFLSTSVLNFEIPIVLEQYRRMCFSPNPDQERQIFQEMCASLVPSIPYAFQEKRMDLEKFYGSIYGAPPNQSVSVLDCLSPPDRAWVEKRLLMEHLPCSVSSKKSKI